MSDRPTLPTDTERDGYGRIVTEAERLADIIHDPKDQSRSAEPAWVSDPGSYEGLMVIAGIATRMGLRCETPKPDPVASPWDGILFINPWQFGVTLFMGPRGWTFCYPVPSVTIADADWHEDIPIVERRMALVKLLYLLAALVDLVEHHDIGDHNHRIDQGGPFV